MSKHQPTPMATPAVLPTLTAETLSGYVRERAASRADLTLEQRREAVDGNADIFPACTNVEVTPVSAGGVAAEWNVPQGSADAACILYFHGGGFVFGSPKSHRHLTTLLADSASMKCLSVDYRLAPEHPFPAALDDAVAAYKWLLDQNVPPQRIAVAGDSAGGGLALSLMVRLRELGVPLPAAAVLISPWTDLICERPSYASRAQADPSVTQTSLKDLAATYLGPADAATPLASPLMADLAGLPPCLVQVGECEVLLDDARDLATRMRQVGTVAELEVWGGMVHVWHALHPMLAEGRQAIQRAADFLRLKVG